MHYKIKGFLSVYLSIHHGNLSPCVSMHLSENYPYNFDVSVTRGGGVVDVEIRPPFPHMICSKENFGKFSSTASHFSHRTNPQNPPHTHHHLCRISVPLLDSKLGMITLLNCKLRIRLNIDL